MNCTTNVIQVTNVSPSTTSEQMRTLFGFLGKIEELRLFPPDDSPLPVTSRVCFVKFLESDSVGVSQHLTNTVFVDRALIVVPFAEGVIPDEAKALSLLAPANAVAGLLPGGGLLPTPNPLASMGGMPLAALGGPNLDPALAALGMPGSNMNSQSLAADQLLKFMTSVDPKLNHVTSGLNLNPGLKADASNKEIEEAMKRVREAQSLISAAIEPGNKKDSKRKRSRSRSRSRSRRRRSRSRSRHRRSRSRSRSRRRSKSPRRRRTRSKERGRGSDSKSRDRKKEEKEKKRSRTPPKSYSATRRSRSISRRRRRSRTASRSPRRKPSRSPSPRRHKKEKKKEREREKDRERNREEEREHSTSKKKNKDKDRERERERERERKSDEKSEKRSKSSQLQAETHKAEVNQVTRDYDEEEQGYDSEKEREEKRDSDSAPSPPPPPPPASEKGSGENVKGSKVNGDDHHEEDMDMSD